MVKRDGCSVECEAVEPKALSKEAVVVALAVLYIANQRVGDVLEVASDLMETSCLGPCGHP